MGKAYTRYNALAPERRRRHTGLLLEEVVEMGWFFKTKAITDLGYIPAGVFQQGLCFTGKSFKYMLGSGFAGGCSDSPV